MPNSFQLNPSYHVLGASATEKRAKKNTSKAWNAQHSMIPTAGRDVPKGTPIGTFASKFVLW
ncbi:MAG: hypothetical protein IKH28_08470 [Lachnospiraceae bacterium]|nr:hypothetical protein [Lachnospiraceae bacterium]